MDVTCPYCQQAAELVTGREVYPRRTDLFEKRFYTCQRCDARVGCHPQTNAAGEWVPFGRMADRALRALRQQVHALIDPIWEAGESRAVKASLRRTTYRWLARELNLDEFHTGDSDEAQCRAAIEVLSRHQHWLGRPRPGEVNIAQQIATAQAATTAGLISSAAAAQMAQEILRRPLLFGQLQEMSYGPQAPQAAARPEPGPQPQQGAGEGPREANRGLLGPRKRLWAGPW